MQARAEQAAHYRTEAERVRKEADTFDHLMLQSQLRSIANTYDQVAVTIEALLTRSQ